MRAALARLGGDGLFARGDAAFTRFPRVSDRASVVSITPNGLRMSRHGRVNGVEMDRLNDRAPRTCARNDGSDLFFFTITRRHKKAMSFVRDHSRLVANAKLGSAWVSCATEVKPVGLEHDRSFVDEANNGLLPASTR